MRKVANALLFLQRVGPHPAPEVSFQELVERYGAYLRIRAEPAVKRFKETPAGSDPELCSLDVGTMNPEGPVQTMRHWYKDQGENRESKVPHCLAGSVQSG